MNVNTILFIGKPGSGKGTQAKLLSEKTTWHTISSGDLFRALAKEDSPVGHKMQKELNEGLLMPDWFAAYLFQKSVLGLSPDAGVLFDGFGRKAPEAKIVLDVLSWLGRTVHVVHIKVSDENIIDRLTKRRDVSGREDDNSIEKRLEEYRLFTDPAIEVFREAGVLIEVDGDRPIETIHEDIVSRLA